MRCDVDPESLSLTLQEMILRVHLVNLCWNGLMHLEDDPPLLDE